MNYEKTVCDMLEHADNSRSPDQMAKLMSALSFGIALLSINVGTIAAQETLLDALFEAIRQEGRAALMDANGMSPEELFRRAVTEGKM